MVHDIPTWGRELCHWLGYFYPERLGNPADSVSTIPIEHGEEYSWLSLFALEVRPQVWYIEVSLPRHIRLVVKFY
ncbi:hypothetical protein RSOLAG1IB_09704 [Rhizoctonia solani AG-1 IB]|uniref:Uncharacterized protein n=1 Tax=Thanatephorus cucumeris (strain AG1-IB / isolate 7/3/14) TaxID=1108050 RepID=A0A0B7FWF6_THACB|nr:hypothetical protein RSOLAG1IB_09704 [Rhizoctonia solani AG-1 IB]